MDDSSKCTNGHNEDADSLNMNTDCIESTNSEYSNDHTLNNFKKEPVDDIESSSASINGKKPTIDKLNYRDKDVYDSDSEEASSVVSLDLSHSTTEEESSDKEIIEVKNLNQNKKVVNKSAHDDDPYWKEKSEKHLLPAIEELHITVEEEKAKVFGEITNIVEDLVVVAARKDIQPINLDSVLFLDKGKSSLGSVFDIFGHVQEPMYCVRFNCNEDILKRNIAKGQLVYFAPTTNHTTFVDMAELMKGKGSDASWKEDTEPPECCLDYSDDEEERQAKFKRKQARKQVKVPFNEFEPPKKQNIGRGNTFRRDFRNTNPGNGPHYAQPASSRFFRPLTPFNGGRFGGPPQFQNGVSFPLPNMNCPPPLVRHPCPTSVPMNTVYSPPPIAHSPCPPSVPMNTSFSFFSTPPPCVLTPQPPPSFIPPQFGTIGFSPAETNSAATQPVMHIAPPRMMAPASDNISYSPSPGVSPFPPPSYPNVQRPVTPQPPWGSRYEHPSYTPAAVVSVSQTPVGFHDQSLRPPHTFSNIPTLHPPPIFSQASSYQIIPPNTPPPPSHSFYNHGPV